MKTVLSLFVSLVLILLLSSTAQAATKGKLVGIIADEHGKVHSHHHESERYAVETDNKLLPVEKTEKVAALVGQEVNRTSASKVSATQDAEVQPIVVGKKQVAVLMVNFDSDTRTPFSTDQVKNTLYKNSNSSENFFKEQSGDVLDFVGQSSNDPDVFGWLRVNGDMSSCDYSALRTNAIAKAKSSGINTDAYDNVIILFPKSSGCGWAGLASVGGGTVWMNGYIDSYILSHELGHNFGSGHASRLSCTQDGSQVALSDTCTQSEYGDSFDVMGTSSSYLSAWRRWKMGLLNSTQAKSVATSGTYSLAPATDLSQSPGYRTIIIPRNISGVTKEWFVLETRNRGGLFELQNASASEYAGINVYLVSNLNQNTKLINTGAGQSAGSYSSTTALNPGESFYDAKSKVKITATSWGTSSSSAEIVLPAQVDAQAPTAPFLTSLASLGKTDKNYGVRVTWNASQDDNLKGYKIYRDGALVATTPKTEYVDFVSVGKHTYAIAAYDNFGNVSELSNQLSITFTETKIPADPTPPTSDPETPPVIKDPVSNNKPDRPTSNPNSPKPPVGVKIGKKGKKWILVWGKQNGVSYVVYKNGKKLSSTDGNSVVVSSKKHTEYAIRATNESGVSSVSYFLYKSKYSKKISFSTNQKLSGAYGLENKNLTIKAKNRKLKVKVGSKTYRANNKLVLAVPSSAKYVYVSTNKKESKRLKVENNTVREF